MNPLNITVNNVHAKAITRGTNLNVSSAPYIVNTKSFSTSTVMKDNTNLEKNKLILKKPLKKNLSFLENLTYKNKIKINITSNNPGVLASPAPSSPLRPCGTGKERATEKRKASIE